MLVPLNIFSIWDKLYNLYLILKLLTITPYKFPIKYTIGSFKAVFIINIVILYTKPPLLWILTLADCKS